MAGGKADLLPVSYNGRLGYLDQSSHWEKKNEKCYRKYVFENDLKSTE